MSVTVADLNDAMRNIGLAPRVRFEAGIAGGAMRWLMQRHANGGLHEPATIAAFLAISNRQEIGSIFDVGAHYGYFSILCCCLFPQAKITAFEMHPGLFNSLQNNVGPSVEYVGAVVGDRDCKRVRFFVSAWNIFEQPADGWEALPDEAKKGRGRELSGYVRTDFITLDTYSEQHGAPDLIKIDVEAYQEKAVLGALGIIERHHPNLIIELHDREKLQRLGTTNARTIKPILDRGYRLFWCGNHRSMNATFEELDRMDDSHEVLSLAVLVPAES